MPKDVKCGEWIGLWNGEYECQCVLPKGHESIRHQNEDGDTWEDSNSDTFLFADEVESKKSQYLKDHN